VSVLTSLGDSDRVASTCGSDPSIKLWDLKSKSLIIELKHHNQSVTAMDFCRNTSILASGAEDNTINFWDLRYPEKYLSTDK
jgi:WD40 repeat protein